MLAIVPIVIVMWVLVTVGGPPGPVCPTNQYKETLFPLNPTPATDTICETGWTWSTGTLCQWGQYLQLVWTAPHNNERVWMNVAAQYEAYDLGPCRGHAANGDYHHHDLSSCLMDQIGETGSGHSDVYGRRWLSDLWTLC